MNSVDFTNFVKDFIREGGYSMNWLEMKKNELTPLFRSRLKYLLNGSAFIMMTDDKRAWYEKYFLSNINSSSNNRPMLPFFSMKSLGIECKYNNEDIDAINDVLDMTFPNGYVYFYVGDNSSKMLNIAKSKDDSFIWLFDEQLSDSLFLDSNTKEISPDIKLITLYILFSACVDATIFSRVTL